jgi:hypothetical protein
MEPLNSGYPASFQFDPPEQVANWRPLVNWLLAIPHLIILGAFRSVSNAVGVVSWFAIVFTGSLPEGLANLQAMYMRYEQRVGTYAGFLREEYPPFVFSTVATDDGQDPRVRVDVRPELANRNRLTVAFRIILVIPQLVVVAALGIAAFAVVIVAFFAVLFTGKYPPGMRTFVINVTKWYVRVEAYFALLTDEYPPFAFVD